MGLQFDGFATRSEPPRLTIITEADLLGRLDEPRKGLDVLLAAVPLIARFILILR
jgi:hypothetical protein